MSKPSAPKGLGEELANALHSNRIPPCPKVLATISQEMNKEEPDFRFLAATIATDVGIAAGLVKLANSPYFGARRRVASVAESLMLLGLDTVSQAVACIALGKAFPSLHSMERFWDASAKIANLSGWLARELDLPGVRSQEAYTYGLFRDCGIAVLLQHFPDYIHVLQKANEECIHAFTSVEDEVLPTNHAITGAMMTQSWWLPESICTAVRHHHDLPVGNASLSESELVTHRLIALAQVAEHLLQDKTGLSHTEEWAKLGAHCLEVLGLDQERLTRLLPGSGSIIAETTAPL